MVNKTEVNDEFPQEKIKAILGYPQLLFVPAIFPGTSVDLAMADWQA